MFFTWESEDQVKARFDAIEKIKLFTFRENLESMSFEQIIDIYQICNSQDQNRKEVTYYQMRLKNLAS
jgi:hypothetical protein